MTRLNFFHWKSEPDELVIYYQMYPVLTEKINRNLEHILIKMFCVSVTHPKKYTLIT